MQPKFTADEKVLCYHGPLLYEAKILKSKKEAGNYSYFVHYQGWNKNWDEWVQEARIMKQVPESYEKQKKLLQNHAAANKAQKKAVKEAKKKKGGSDSGANSRASTPVGDRLAGRPPKRSIADDERSNSSRDEEMSNPASTSSTPLASKEGRVKRRKDTERDTGELEESMGDSVLSDEPMDTKYQIELPDELKTILTNDWDLVVHQRHLFKVPAKVTVSNIIEQYVAHLDSLTMPASKRSVATEVIKGLGEYFNVSLGPQLLYSVEKLQYREDCESAGAVQPADMYGSTHLLRLMVKIGNYLSCSHYQGEACKTIEEHIDDFLTYLDINRSMFFSSKNYHTASPEYLLRCGGAK